MILDTLDNAGVYAKTHPGLKAAFAWLKRNRKKLGKLPVGRQEIDGLRLYALVNKGPGKGKAARLEVHRKYMDIQLTLAGSDLIGWKPLAGCRKADGQFDLKKDIGFFKDKPDVWLSVPKGSFAVFFPEDVHAPMAVPSKLHKIIVKIALKW